MRTPHPDVVAYAQLRCAARLAIAAKDLHGANGLLAKARTLFAGMDGEAGAGADALLVQFSRDLLLSDPTEALRRIGYAAAESVG